MGQRRAARERALEVLFELEFNEAGPEAVLVRRKEETGRPEALAYAAWIVRGVAARRDEIDGLIQGSARNWRVARMGFVDRNILRIAVYEMLEEKTLVPAIIIDEAVEIARRYCGEESALFVNGVLDAVRIARFAPPPSPNQPKTDAHERTSGPKPASQRRRGAAPVKK